MRRVQQFSAGLLLIIGAASVHAQAKKSEPTPIYAVAESSLPSAKGHIRQFAFDGNGDSYFASAKNAGKEDHFTLVFDKPVAVKSIAVSTGKPDGGDALEEGTLEVSTDGKKFDALAKFAKGTVAGKPMADVVAVRVKPAADQKNPLTIREFTIDSTPPVLAFKYPVEFIVDVKDAPEMKDWADKVARLCEREYRMINEELKSDGFKPLTEITMTMKSDYKGVAQAGGGKITGSVAFFKARPDDTGAFIHETVHCVQLYRTRNNPGWLVEGIADYVRFIKFEPAKIGRINPQTAKHDGSYRVSAAFLGYVANKYDKDLVLKLNKSMREGEYKEEIWKALTKKSLQELGDEWKASLRK